MYPDMDAFSERYPTQEYFLSSQLTVSNIFENYFWSVSFHSVYSLSSMKDSTLRIILISHLGKKMMRRLVNYDFLLNIRWATIISPANKKCARLRGEVLLIDLIFSLLIFKKKTTQLYSMKIFFLKLTSRV